MSPDYEAAALAMGALGMLVLCLIASTAIVTAAFAIL